MVRRSDIQLTLFLVPAIIVLVVAAMRVNDGFYGFWVNDDPQGDDQLREMRNTTWIYRYTAGVLCGQFLSLLVGFVLCRRRRWAALAAASASGVLLAAITVAVAIPLARFYGRGEVSPPPVPVRLLVVELVAYPLWAAVGVGVGALLAYRLDARRRRSATPD